MKINDMGLALLKSFEGLRLKAYQDSVGVWTVGYGSTKNVTPGVTITEDEAEERLIDDLVTAETGVNKIIDNLGLTLNPNQFAALVSFAYNVGVGTLAKSSIIRHLDDSEYTEAADAFLKYIFAKGVKLPGLVRRRTEERKLFLS